MAIYSIIRRPRSIQGQFMALIVASLLPALFIIAFVSYRYEGERVKVARETALQTARAVVSYQHGLAEDSRSFLSTLALVPSVEHMAVAECSRLFPALLERNPRYTNIFMADTKGRIIAAALTTGNLDIQTRDYYAKAMKTGLFSVGQYITGRASHRLVIPFALPLKDASGRVRGIIGCSVGLSEITRTVGELNLPPKSSVTLCDSGGVILYRYPDVGYAGSKVTEQQLAAMKSRLEGSVTIRGIDGITRLYAYSALQRDDGAPFVHILVGIPTQAMVEQARRVTTSQVGIELIVGLLTLLFARYLGTRVIAKKVARLADTAQRFAGGDLSVRTGLPHDDTEMGVLAGTFDNMADALAQRERMLRAEQQKLDTTLRSIGDAVISTDASGRIELLNQVAEQLTGWRESDAIGQPLHNIFRIVNESTRQACENPVEKVLMTGLVVGLANHTVLIARDGKEAPIDDSCAPIVDSDGLTVGAVLVFRDVTDRKRSEAEMKYLSFHDKLTGLFNRPYLEKELKRHDWATMAPMSVIVGDLNGLKLTNDAFGHDAGDALLIRMANILRASIEEMGVVARWGGDEFIAVLPDVGVDEVAAICESIRTACLVEEFDIVPLSIGLGSATRSSAEGPSNAQLLKEAEEHMYHNKLLEGRSVRNGLISSLRGTLAAKTHETAEHSWRLQALALDIGRHLRLPDNVLDDLGLLSVLHDIGKVGIPEAILDKPGPLTEDEWETVKKHPEIGYRIAKSSHELSHIAEGILSHHERWDGGGYPQSLAGTDIPIISRIVSVADAYDVMVSGRPYKSRMSQEQVIAEMRRCSGRQFDPSVVDVLIPILLRDVAPKEA